MQVCDLLRTKSEFKLWTEPATPVLRDDCPDHPIPPGAVAESDESDGRDYDQNRISESTLGARFSKAA